MKKSYLGIVLFAFFSLIALQSCDDDIDSNYGVSQVSWMPIKTIDGGDFKPTYVEGETIEFVVKFKMFDGNEVQSIAISQAIVDEVTAIAGPETFVKEYTSADFEVVPEELQYKVNASFEIEKDKFIDQKLELGILFTTVNGNTQKRTVQFSVSEFFPSIVEGVTYYYMYDNTHTNAGLGYTTEHSAGYTTAVTVMNYYDFDPNNATYQAELGGKLENHTVDWVASYYVDVWPQILAQNVADLHRVYINESPYYGGPKSLKSTELGTYAEIDAAIANGQMVIVHGDFRGDVAFKHQMILVATNDNSFLALDPAGKWNGEVNGEYLNNNTAGFYVKYSKADVYAAIGADGSVDMHIPVDPADASLTLDE